MSIEEAFGTELCAVLKMFDELIGKSLPGLSFDSAWAEGEIADADKIYWPTLKEKSYVTVVDGRVVFHGCQVGERGGDSLDNFFENCVPNLKAAVGEYIKGLPRNVELFDAAAMSRLSGHIDRRSGG